MGKNVLIIGASGDIGIAIAQQLAKDGYTLLLHYNTNRKMIDQLREGLEESSVLAVLQADLCEDAAVKKFLTELVFPVDGIIFASGLAHFGVFQETPETVMDKMINLHVKAPWMIIKYILPQMVKRQSGTIIFITSIWGEQGASNEVIYSSVKGAQNSFVKALAKEAAPSGISVNGVSPGFIETKMNGHLPETEKEMLISEIPANRAGRPEEIAHAVSFLFDSRSNYIQGEIINVTGGW
ncbi:SDR family oxidoreductase [Virgibacillus sp. YIM 98842]|jgi:3-oxoacyl-[acyl-carrier protein] reductase|uniref:elongation factor P 5-aminopentanone reductase n=1 Tax=Virgibacillus sp. YIM 98842 TaxID=2663533 RepID=UPI0013D8FE88|nr:SDR family oxidoreductase [Virgibacillus sp. YIM 98842]